MESKGEIRRDVFQIKGDIADPSGRSGLRGQMSSVDLTQSAEGYPLVYDRTMQRLLTVDVYRMEGAPTWLHLFCPKCENAIKITEETKDIDYEKGSVPRQLLKLFDVNYLCSVLYPGKEPRLAMLDGTLSVSPFRCTYPHDGTVCGWSAVIDHNIARTP